MRTQIYQINFGNKKNIHTFASAFGGLAQLARAPALQAGGRRFDSDILHRWRLPLKDNLLCFSKGNHTGCVSDKSTGALAHLVERNTGSVEVSGSSPLCSTSFPVSYFSYLGKIDCSSGSSGSLGI